MRLSSNGQQYSTSHGVFTFVGAHSVHGVSPSSGSVNGGTIVSVDGMGFLQSSLLRLQVWGIASTCKVCEQL